MEEKFIAPEIGEEILAVFEFPRNSVEKTVRYLGKERHMFLSPDWGVGYATLNKISTGFIRIDERGIPNVNWEVFNACGNKSVLRPGDPFYERMDVPDLTEVFD
jgi:hypothetical protein